MLIKNYIRASLIQNYLVQKIIRTTKVFLKKCIFYVIYVKIV